MLLLLMCYMCIQYHKPTSCLVTYKNSIMYGLRLFFTLKLKVKGEQTSLYDVAHLAIEIYLCAKFHGLILSGW